MQRRNRHLLKAVVSAMVFGSAIGLVSESEAVEISSREVEASVVRNFPLIQKAGFDAEAFKQKRLAAEGEFDTKFKVKSANRFDDKYDYRDLETVLEKQLPFQGLKVFAGHHLGLGDIPEYTGKYETSRAGEVFAGARLPILRNRSIDEARYRLLEADFNQAIAQVDIQRQANSYLTKALAAFQKWKLAYRKLATYSSLLDIASNRQTMLEKQVRLGDVERIGLIDSRRSLLKRQAEVADAQNELNNAKSELSLYLVDADGKSIDLDTKTPDLSLEAFPSPSAFTIDPNKIPQVSVLTKSQELQEKLVDYGKNQRLPALDVSAATYHALPSTVPVDTTRLQVGVFFELPLENRKGRGLEGEARAKSESLERQRRYLEAEIKTRLQQASNTMRTALTRIQLLDEELKSAKTVAEAERKRWRAGDSNLFMVAAREEEAASVEIRRWTAEYDFRSAEIDARLTTATFETALR